MPRRDHGGLLAERASHGSVVARRLAAYRRRRRLGRGGLSPPQGPLQGPDYFRRFQHLSARGGGGATHAWQGARGLGHRASRPGMGRGGGGLCGGQCRSRRARCAVPDTYCALQAAEGLCFCRRAPEKQLRQGSQDGTARHGCRKDPHSMNEIDRKTSLPRCPLCGKATEPAFKPFCSKRCADIDLNRWLSGVYAVPVKEDEEEDGERPAEGEPGEKS